jgi:amidohydrolase
MRDELIRRRRDFHRYPELAFQEVRTAGMVAEELTRMGLEVQTGVGKTGVVGILEGEQDGPTVLLRADMDALPIVEENTFPYISTQAGVMHACGHDGHTTIALGVAKLLSQHREQIAGRVKFVFQPAEEIAAGAKAMVADGVLRDPKPDVCVGLHLWNSLPFGQLGVADGPIMAGSSEFILKIQGKGGHAANPHMTIDPVVCAAQLITAFQTIASRNVDPLDSAVISVTQMAAGTAFNVIPQSAELRGTMRFFRLEVRETMERRMNEISRGIAAALGCTVELEIDRQLLPVINHSSVGERLRPIFQQMMGAANLVNERTMGAEDVGLLMGDIPGMYLLLGANPGTEPYYGHHHPRFDFHEDALPVGVALLAAAAAAYILPEG